MNFDGARSVLAVGLERVEQPHAGAGDVGGVAGDEGIGIGA